VNCRCCQSEEIKRRGFYRNQNFTVQRFKCLRCGTSFSEQTPLDGLRVPMEKVVQVIQLMVESMGIRAISRFTGLDQETVLNILEVAGQKAARLSDTQVRNVKTDFVQVDELVNFVKTKQQNTEKDDREHGSFFTHLSVDRDSKCILNFRVSKREREDSLAFMQDLRARINGRFSLCTDGLKTYISRDGVISEVFGDGIDYASEVKVFQNPRKTYWNVFTKPTVVAIKRKARIGNPDLSMSTTCHAERMNLSVRLFNRRFTRQTLGYSKKLENLRHSVALFIWHFNFCRVHSAHKQTPAMAAGLADRQWTIREMLEEKI
jgi:transposase-like protein